jgi:hypothetical protein
VEQRVGVLSVARGNAEAEVSSPYPRVDNVAGWLKLVEQTIASHTVPTEDPNHGATDSLAWVADVAQMIEGSWPEGWEKMRAGDPGAFDENMRMARELGLVLCAWYASVHRAKSRDPNRPIGHRRMAHARRILWLQDLIAAVTDDEWDPSVFPGQKFESPFAPGATDGTFV